MCFNKPIKWAHGQLFKIIKHDSINVTFLWPDFTNNSIIGIHLKKKKSVIFPGNYDSRGIHVPN